MPLPMGASRPHHLTHGSVGPREFVPQIVSWLVQPFLHNTSCATQKPRYSPTKYHMLRRKGKVTQIEREYISRQYWQCDEDSYSMLVCCCCCSSSCASSVSSSSSSTSPSSSSSSSSRLPAAGAPCWTFTNRLIYYSFKPTAKRLANV